MAKKQPEKPTVEQHIAGYPPEKLQEFEEMLLKRRIEIVQGIADQREETEGFHAERQPDDYDDAASNVDMNIHMMLNDTQKRELDQIEIALRRIKNGTYGICEVTGELISEARLRALPYTTMSVEAATRAERGRVEFRRETRSVPIDDDFLLSDEDQE